jgi:flagellar hook-associated protein 3 FlgL
MRITNRMLATNFLGDMRRNLNNMQKLQSQLSSGKEIRKPSDNPFKVARSMQLNTDIQANKQYNENIKDTLNWLDATDTALDQVTNVFQRVRELMVSAGNAAYGSDEKKAIKDEINQKVEELSQILNTNFDGKYIFGGTKGTSKPMGVATDANGNKTLFYSGKEGEVLDETSGDTNQINQLNMLKSKLNVEISPGVTIEYNVTSSELLKFTNDKGKSINVGDLLKDIVSNLDSKDSTAAAKVTGENLEDITSTLSNLLKVRAEVGAKQNRMEAAQAKNEEENFNMTEILSKTEDIDITEKMMEYSTMQTVYMASLQTSAKVLQPTLMDYLR